MTDEPTSHSPVPPASDQPGPPPGSPPYQVYGVPGHATSMVDADPESAGFLRVEQRGWALGFAGLGSIAMLVALALPWIRTGSEGLKVRGDDGTRVDIDETAGLFSAIDTIRDSTRFAERGADPGDFAGLFFPTVAIGSTVLCIVVVLLAAFGLRRRGLTNTLRVLGVLVTGATFLALAFATYDADVQLSWSGGTGGTATAEAAGGGDPGPMDSFVHLHHGAILWLVGLALLALAAMLGPRVVHRPPGGAAFAAVPGQAVGGAPGTSYAGTGMVPLLRHTTQPVAAVVTGIGAIVCFAGYGFLPWGPDTTFSEISDAIREYGLEDKPLTEAYFAWLGWVIMAAMAAVALLVALGKKPSGVNPRSLRPFLAGTALVLAGVHLWVLINLLSEGGELDAGSVAVSAGVVLVVIGTLLPLRVSARMMVGPAQGIPHPYPPGQQPPDQDPPAQQRPVS